MGLLLLDVFVNIIEPFLLLLITVQSYAAFTRSMFHKRCLMFHQKHKSFGALRIMP